MARVPNVSSHNVKIMKELHFLGIASHAFPMRSLLKIKKHVFINVTTTRYSHTMATVKHANLTLFLINLELYVSESKQIAQKIPLLIQMANVLAAQFIRFQIKLKQLAINLNVGPIK